MPHLQGFLPFPDAEARLRFLIADSEADAREQFGMSSWQILLRRLRMVPGLAHTIVSLKRVPSGQVRGELRAIRDDGRFFDDEE
ncbi:MAG: hypothetical protein BGO51_26040 [Rhodospirillales bacterium 69-11]|nr:hypothetical protein [Rhodospirillales bacterium]OJW21035.1 MAG: hypothetical protein BGO51_26040 [Rhodospirillales bacterium 69-11]